jgi:hypothetical protein
MVVRDFDIDETEMPQVGRDSRDLIENEFPEIVWEHTHVVVDDAGKVRTFCVYAAPDEDQVRRHSSRLGRHTIDSLSEIAGDVAPSDFPALVHS